MEVTGEENYVVYYEFDRNNRIVRAVRTGDNPSITDYFHDRNGNQLGKIVTPTIKETAFTQHSSDDVRAIYFSVAEPFLLTFIYCGWPSGQFTIEVMPGQTFTVWQLPPNPTPRVGYMFNGWYTGADAGFIWASPGMLVMNDLYFIPHWRSVDPRITYFLYNVHNQLVMVATDDMLAEYTYKANGLRLTKTVNGVKTTHVWDGMNIVAELDADGNLTNRWIRGFGLLRDMHGVWFIHNGLGDVAALMNQAGQVLRRYRYSAFGVEFDQDPNDTNPWRYRGEYFDTETGMIYLRARFMNPRTGRFITADPYWGVHNMQNCVLSMLQASNLFLYTLNNPLMFIDPTGLFMEPSDLLAWALSIAGGLALADGPLPFGTAAAGILLAGTGITVGVMQLIDWLFNSSTSATHTLDASITFSQIRQSSMTREQAISYADAMRRSGQTLIFRSGSGNATNFTPRLNELALSFYLNMPSGSFTMTTIEIVNANGLLVAIVDGANHASVSPVNPLWLPGWQESRSDALNNPHPLTTLLQRTTIRVR